MFFLSKYTTHSDQLIIKMFDFLNKLSHNHSPTPQLSVEANEFRMSDSSDHEDFNRKGQKPTNNVSIKRSPPSIASEASKIQIKKHEQKTIEGSSIIGKMQKKQKIQLAAQVVDIFNGMLKNSQFKLSEILLSKVHSAKIHKQKTVFIRQTSNDRQEYLEQVSNRVQIQNYFLKQGISNTIDGIINQISNEIQQNAVQSAINKKKYTEDQKNIETLKLIKLRESELHQKIGQLNIDLSQNIDFVERRAIQIVDQHDFNPDSLKTKLAEEFVRNKQREREYKKAELEQMKEKKRIMQIELKEEQEREVEYAKKQKHERLIEQFVQKQRQKKKRQEQARTQHLHFKQFLKGYKQQKPLYQQKEESFEQKLKEEKIERYHILKEKQAKYEPLNIETIQMHEEKYQELRKEDRDRKYAEMQLKKQEEILRKKELDQKVYKGKFRYLILHEMVEAQAKQRQKQADKQAILMKKQAYSLEVKERYKPKVDLAKKQELQQLINSSRNKKRKYNTPNRVAYSEHYSTISSAAYPSNPAFSEPDMDADPQRQGKKYHRLFKQYIRDKIEKGEIREKGIEKKVQTLQPRPNYLKELRQRFQGKIPSLSSRLDRQIQMFKQTEDYGAVLLKAEEFEKRAHQREVKLRNSPHSPQDEARLQQQYLCAIKAKMSLINNMD